MHFADVRKVDRTVGVDAIHVVDLVLVFSRHAADFEFDRIADSERGLRVGADSRCKNQKENREQTLHQYSSGSKCPFSAPFVETLERSRRRRWVSLPCCGE